MNKKNINKINLFTITILGSFFEVTAFTQCDSTCLDTSEISLLNFNYIEEVATRPKTEAPPTPPATSSLLPPPPPPAPAPYVPPSGWVQSCSYDPDNYVGVNIFQVQGLVPENHPDMNLYNHNYMILAGMAAAAPPHTNIYVKNNKVLEIIGLPNNTGTFKPQYGAREYNAGTLRHSGSFLNSFPPVNQNYSWSMHPNGWATYDICKYVPPPLPPAPPPTPPVPVPPGSAPPGQVGGVGKLKINIAWNGTEDVDIRVADPTGHAYGVYGSNISGCSGYGHGCWDIDTKGYGNAPETGFHNQENVFYPDYVPLGRYIIHLYRFRGRSFSQTRISVSYAGINKSIFMPYDFHRFGTRTPYPIYGVIDVTSTGFELYLMQ